MRDWIYELTLKPLFFRLNPESAHNLSVKLLSIFNSLPGIFKVIDKLTSYNSPRLQTEVAGIKFLNPLGMAAGFDKTGELYPFLGQLGFGHVEVGTITGEAQPGNPKPRIFRYEKEEALINRMGFNNPGAEYAFETISKQKKTIIRGINAGKTKLVSPENAIADYVKTFKILTPLADYGVINISSPNTPGLRGFQEKESFITLINGIKEGLGGNFPLPMFVKLAPDLEFFALEELLDIILDIKLDGVILTNTTINPSVLPNYSNLETGGISGKVLREKSTQFIRKAYNKLQKRIPIIGVGGIYDGESALEKIKAGANLIQIYTAYIYKGPFLPYKILEYLDQKMILEGIKSIDE
ncbi:MAG: quinone-dependent dihydroorotate dehydrogenase, partial [Spirochaetia bacterium]|nr:quinone-dependent dihydroorotate dehydrogenase [Spirochaetia bacterium]